MSNNKILIAVVTAVILLGGSFLVFGQGKTQTPIAQKVMNKASEVMQKTESKIMDAKKSWTSTEMEKMAKDEAMAMEKMTPEAKEAMSKKSMEKEMPGDVMMKKEGEVMMAKSGYLAYSPETLAANATGKNIIFFHAPWCPTCKATEASINGSLDKIPAGTNILKADYDTSTELKKKYGVTSQHTFVVVDGQGNKLSMTTGANTLEDVLALVK